MTNVVQEISEQVAKLDMNQQQQVLAFVRGLADSRPKLSMTEWLVHAEAFQDELRARYGDSFTVGSQALLEEIREERLDDLLGSR